MMTDRELVDGYFGAANPNPFEFGCLEANEIDEVAEGKLPLDHPVCEHIALCSPCYQRVRQMQLASKPRLGSWWRVAAAVAVAALGATAVWFMAASRPEPVHQAWEVDLRPWGVRRDDRAQSAAIPVIRRDHKRVEFILPTGCEPGQYEVAIIDSDLRLRHFAEAILRDGRTVLVDVADYRSLKSSQYTLGLRFGEESWKTFPIRLE